MPANEVDKRYDARKIEAQWYSRWVEGNFFHADAAPGGVPYCIVIPPPNVTGILHMGHALNNTIQDILVRWRRMQGRNTVWMPGTDHAGIATQNVVERALRAEGRTREQLGREEFLKRMWAWKEQYGRTIIEQLKKLGCSCDWPRERFTMDEGLSRAVAEVFVRLYEKRLIYRGNYIINWCPRCQTALSDEESEHKDTAGKLYYIRYPVGAPDGREGVTVATTRPETLLGDVAVAVNPRDERYRSLRSRPIFLPVLGRRLAVIEDDFVDPEFGTGVVKVTPAHDPNDFEMGQRHGLAPVNVMNGDGTMNEEAGPYRGLDRFECRRRIVADLTAAGLVEKIVPHSHAVGHCYRCHTMVEPRLSLQWFVKMKPLAEPAAKAVRDGRIVFVPERWTGVYLDWMEHIRDWCISRQIWWGHRIPVFYCEACGNEWAVRGQPPACPKCRSDRFRQDPDVLDTWFSSWLWPFSTFGWPERNADLDFYYPTDTLVTASEIIFFWVARMIMAGFEFMGDIPFRQVYIHGTVRDDIGRKMSKSLGNSVDPLVVIEEFGADALRFSLMMITATGQDVYLSKDKFEIGRNFATKLWNATRYLLMQGGADAAGDALDSLDGRRLNSEDRNVLYRVNRTIGEVTEALERFRFNDAAHALYEFVWHDFCDWYVECSKDVLYGKDAEARARVLAIMRHVFSRALRLLHPMMPFVTEEIWHALKFGGDAETIMKAPWPVAASEGGLAALGATPEVAEYVGHKHDLIRTGRMLRADYGIPPSRLLDYIIKPVSAGVAEQLTADRESLLATLRAKTVTVDPAYAGTSGLPSSVEKLGTIFMPVEGIIDVAAEKRRLSGELESVAQELERVNAKLGNANFVNKAPPEVVEQQKRRRQELEEKAEKLRRLISMLSA
jgi:valyl-tRNA synthetase